MRSSEVDSVRRNLSLQYGSPEEMGSASSSLSSNKENKYLSNIQQRENFSQSVKAPQISDSNILRGFNRSMRSDTKENRQHVHNSSLEKNFENGSLLGKFSSPIPLASAMNNSKEFSSVQSAQNASNGIEKEIVSSKSSNGHSFDEKNSNGREESEVGKGYNLKDCVTDKDFMTISKEWRKPPNRVRRPGHMKKIIFCIVGLLLASFLLVISLPPFMGGPNQARSTLASEQRVCLDGMMLAVCPVQRPIMETNEETTVKIKVESQTQNFTGNESQPDTEEAQSKPNYENLILSSDQTQINSSRNEPPKHILQPTREQQEIARRIYREISEEISVRRVINISTMRFQTIRIYGELVWLLVEQFREEEMVIQELTKQKSTEIVWKWLL